MKIAMWSGPRNLSTAMMYSFAARGDCAVWDEPFYAAYLDKTGLNHPMRDDILAAGERDPAKIAARLTGDIPDDKPVFYQKHMCQHMIDGVPRDWMNDLTNVFLIRHPARVMASFSDKYEAATLTDIGFLQQQDLFNQVADALGQAPVVIDSADIRRDPATMLQKLCTAIDLPYTDKMLTWPAGGHKDDGVWAPVWYGAVHKSTGFAAAEGPLPALSGPYADIAEAALPAYTALARYKL